MKRPRRPWRWWGKWLGTAVAVALAAAWLASGWYILSAKYESTSWEAWVQIEGGAISSAAYRRDPAEPHFPGVWLVNREDPAPLLNWSWRVRTDIGIMPDGIYAWDFNFPLLYFAVVCAVLAGWLWFRDRRRLPGHCPYCNYDLSATPSGVCPECGREAMPAT